MSTLARSVRCAGALALLALAGCGADPSTPARPNVVVLVIDTLRADRLAMYGHEPDTTPFLSGLARRGVVFEDAWSTSSWTAPATASLFTGRYPSQHGVLTGMSLFRRNQVWDSVLEKSTQLNRIPSELVTMPEMFAAAGYRTYGVADNINVCEEEGFASGFGRFAPGNYVGGEAVVDKALAWKDELRATDEPFFLYLHPIDPHQPYHDRGADFDWDALPAEDRTWLESTFDAVCTHCKGAPSLPSEAASKFRELEDPVVRERRRAQALELIGALYDSELRYLDGHLERLFRELDLERDSIVVFTSDHGESFDEHGLMGHPFALFDELLDVPLVFRLPGDAAPHGRRSFPASLVDILPTLRELIGAPPDPGSPGRSLVDAIHGRESDERRALLASRTHERPVLTRWKRAVRADGFKLTLDGPESGTLLFDVTRDPGELENLAESAPDRVAELTRLLDELERTLETHEREFVEIEMDQATLEHLEALGYLGNDARDGAAPAPVDDAAAAAGNDGVDEDQ